MPNIELLEKSLPVAPIRIAALSGCQDLAKEVDKKLVKFRKELVAKKKSEIIPQGYCEPSFLVECECVRFGTGEGKGYIKESVRGTDPFYYGGCYKLQRNVHCMRSREPYVPGQSLSGPEKNHFRSYRKGSQNQCDHAVSV